MPEYKLTYFDARGLAETSRILFAIAGVEYEDNRIPFPGHGTPVPPEIKEKCPFGQVPLLEVGDMRLGQSQSIARFLARRFKLHGGNDLEGAKVDEILDAIKDYRDSLRAAHLGTEEEKAKGRKNVEEVTTPKYIGKFNGIIEKNGSGFLVGSSVSLADVDLYNLITSVRIIGNMDVTVGYPAVQGLVKKVEAIPQVKAWLEKRPKTAF